VLADSLQTEEKFPPEELEWLVTMAFNHAVDLYAANEDEPCREWATKSINLAHYCEDGGSLERACQDRYLKLKFG
jgi:hypothetical protein